MKSVDLAVIGGGIVGLATAYQFTARYPDRSIVVLEKEPELAAHQTGHNSGVLHSGIYYKPGSLKALNCRAGKKAMEDFCEQEGIAYRLCGKVIVAVSQEELPALERIYQRGLANGVACSLIDKVRLQELEPSCAGIAAIHVPEAGIVNYRHVCRRLAEIVSRRGGEVLCRARVMGMRNSSADVTLTSEAGDISARHVINCAGLHSDRVAKLSGLRPEAKIIPFLGKYYAVKPAAGDLCRSLIYPTPDARFPFLGVHFTRMIDGSLECGPNAVLALGREAYRLRDFRLTDLTESLTYPGFIRMAGKHWRMGMKELWRTLSKAAFLRALQRLIPAITAADIEPAPSGIRAQAVTPRGELVDDFWIEEKGRVVNVCNAPSPAATASLHIGKMIVERLALTR
jgi:L-2-hydroxyglutarate oxidase